LPSDQHQVSKESSYAALRRFASMINWIGRRSVIGLSHVGYAARMFGRLTIELMPLVHRPRLVMKQLLFIGNYSLLIISVSGLFVGFVFGFQGYYTLKLYGSEAALGLLVALALVRELGPVITALLFEGWRTAIGHRDDSGRPDQDRYCAADAGRRNRNAAPRCHFQCRMRDRWLYRRCSDDWRRFRRFLVTDARRRRRLARCRKRCGKEYCFWLCGHLHFSLSGVRSATNTRRGVERNNQNGSLFVTCRAWP